MTGLAKKSQCQGGELEKPHRHDLLHFDAPVLYRISKRIRERGYFLHKELEERGIWGPQPGLAKSFKLSTFAADGQQFGVVAGSFKDILSNALSRPVEQARGVSGHGPLSISERMLETALRQYCPCS